MTMQRKLASQKVERLLSRGGKDLDVLGRKIARWVADHQAQLATLADVMPDLPGALGNRSADNWIELVGLADLIGGRWPEVARRAAVEISGGLDVDDQSYGVQLLGDIKEVFEATKAEAIWTEDLLRHLHAMSEAPWCEYGRQRKPITARQLATCSSRSGSCPGHIRTRRWQHEERLQAFFIWNRYLSLAPRSNATTPQPTATATFSDFPSATRAHLWRLRISRNHGHSHLWRCGGKWTGGAEEGKGNRRCDGADDRRRSRTVDAQPVRDATGTAGRRHRRRRRLRFRAVKALP